MSATAKTPRRALVHWAEPAGRVALGLCLLGAAWLALIAFGHLGADFTLAKPWPMLLDLGLAAVLLPLGCVLLRRLCDPGIASAWVFWIVVGVAFLASRLAVLYLFPTQPVSDFLAYHDLARRIAAGQALPPADELPLFFAWGYSLLLAPFYALFGATVATAQVTNVLAGLAGLPLIGAFGRQAGGAAIGRAAGLLYTAWPAQLFLTPVVASEHFALLFMLVGLWAVLLTTRTSAWWPALAGGLGCGLAAVARPALGVLLPVMLVLPIIVNQPWRRRVARAAILLATFVVVQFGYRATATAICGRPPPTVAWWNLMAGMNYEARGRWNQADADAFFAHRTRAESNAFAQRTITTRAWKLSWRWPDHARRKLQLLWGDNYYGLWWATRSLGEAPPRDWVAEQLARWFTWSQLVHLTLIVLAGRGLWRVLRGKGMTAAVLAAVLVVLSGTVLHAVFETQSRYAHVFTLGGLILAALGLVRPGWAAPSCGLTERP